MSARQRLKAAFQLVAWDLTAAAAGASIGSVLAAVILLPAPLQFLLVGTLAGGVSGAAGAVGAGRAATAVRRQLGKAGLGEDASVTLALLASFTGFSLAGLIGGSALASTGIVQPEPLVFLGVTAWAGVMWGSVCGIARPVRPAPQPAAPAPNHTHHLRQHG